MPPTSKLVGMGGACRSLRWKSWGVGEPSKALWGKGLV